MKNITKDFVAVKDSISVLQRRLEELEILLEDKEDKDKEL